MSVDPIVEFELGQLWPRIVAARRHALASGALHSIPTTYEQIEQNGFPFLVRQLTNLVRKDADQAQSANRKTPKNPFLPPEEDLVVADISATHLCVLNKFNVVDHHCLLITRDFEPQDAALTLADFTALAACLGEFPGLAFYNGGPLAGASQPHKHLQIVPLPFDPQCDRVPLEAIFPPEMPNSPTPKIENLAVLPFQHGLIRWRSLPADPLAAAHELLNAYATLLKTLDLGDVRQTEQSGQPQPYNLLVTRNWMFMVPRSQEAYHSIAVNALGFAGALLVRNDEQLRFIQDVGPLHILEQVAKPLL